MTTHILNGDALADRFPTEISGDRIVFRECLIEGPVQASNLKEFLTNRDHYLSETYPLNSPDYYQKEVIPELLKISKLRDGAHIYLWFEEDLFCLMNAWFVMYLLSETDLENDIYWVHPPMSLRYGFAGLTNEELTAALKQSIKIQRKDLNSASQLWQFIADGNYPQIYQIRFSESLDFLNKGLEYLINFKVKNHAEQMLRSIVANYQSPEFGSVFREFTAVSPEYGLGDLQVKRLFDKIVTN